jgi:uncharacterized protein
MLHREKSILPKMLGFINHYRPCLRFEHGKTLKTLQYRIATAHSRQFASAYSHIAMKLHPTVTQQYQTVTGYDEHSVEINAKPYTFSLIVLPETPPTAWPVAHFDALSLEHFTQIDATQPDVVILGTGRKQRFVHPKLSAVLTSRRIGIECMDNHAACRTYNILMAEGRKVALALIIEAQAPSGQA